MLDSLDFSRIQHLVDRQRASDLRIVAVGLGSGGARVVQQLAMSGLRRWDLFDPDTLDPVNLVKHPARRCDLGRPKVDVMAEWLADRNPTSEVATHPEDIRGSRAFEEAVRRADLVLCGVDNLASREYLNDVCMRLRVPFVVGSVFRTGFGGEASVHVPGWSGCFRCLGQFAEEAGVNMDASIGLTEIEKERIYGMNEEDFSLSGLATDIATIASLQAHMVLGVLFGTAGTPIPPLDFSWVVFGNRPQAGFFARRFEARRLMLRPRRDCPVDCGMRRRRSPWDVLGIEPDAPSQEARKAYRDLVRRVHPDRFAQASDLMRQLASERTIEAEAAMESFREQEAVE